MINTPTYIFVPSYMGTSYSTVCTSITVNHMFVFGCIQFIALQYTIDADGKSLQFITIVQVVLY